MKPETIRIVLCTFPDIERARQIGTNLVEKQLAACINLLPCIESTYRWEGRTETSQEVMGLFKTTAALFPEFSATLEALHPYEVPEILALDCVDAGEAYARWVMDSLR